MFVAGKLREMTSMAESSEKARLIGARLVLTGSLRTLNSLINKLETERSGVEDELRRVEEMIKSLEQSV